ncbi:MAG: hypothetical protein ACXU87_25220 [Xanthobacteraceae bacterium]
MEAVNGVWAAVRPISRPRNLAEGDLVLDYGAMAGQANFMTIGRPGIGKFER